jgi:hypothetical protein
LRGCFAKEEEILQGTGVEEKKLIGAQR